MGSDAAVARALRLDTSTLSDALDRLGISGQCLGIRPVHARFGLAGRAFTVLYRPLDAIAPGNVGDYIDDVAADSVVVLDNGGRPDATVWGDILTFVAQRRGIAGSVIDGACRDIHLSLELGYPIFSRSVSMRTGKDRVQVDGYNVAVQVGGVRVRPGDLMRGDGDGVVAIPSEREDEVLSVAEAIDAAEARIRAAVEGGARLADARAEARYHTLQTRSAD